MRWLGFVCVLLLAGCGARPAGAPAPQGFSLYLVQKGKLTPVVRPGQQPTISDAVELLAAGPLPEESGYTSEVPKDTRLLSVGRPPPALTLSVDVSTLSDNAVNQILCTVGFREMSVLIGQGHSRGPQRCSLG